jgi:hypothetical protein
MISAPTGGRPNVIGSSIAIVATVPIPGNTPTRVPTNAPSKQNRMFIGENATPKPSAKFERSSDMATSTAMHQFRPGMSFAITAKMLLNRSANWLNNNCGAFACGQSWNGRFKR